MAQNQQGFHPQAPAFARSRPDAYYAWLTSNGFPHQVAYDQTTAIFGPPKTPQEQQEEAARQQQQAGFAQAGGMIGGAVAANYAMNQGLFSGAGTATGTGVSTGAGAGAGAGAGTGAGVGAGVAGAGAGAGGAGAVTLTGGGVATIPAGAAVPAGYTAVGTSATGATMVAPTAGAAGASAAGAGGAGASSAGAGAGASGAGSAAATAGIVAAIIIGLQNLYETGGKDILKGRADRSDWLNMAFPNMLPRLLGRKSIGKALTSGKSSPQLERDDFRGVMKQLGVADNKYHVTLADGSKFNIGLDGRTKYQNLGENIDGKTTRNAWDVDWSNPLAKYASEQIDPLLKTMYKDNPKAKVGQYTGMLVNAVTSNAKNQQDVVANINSVLGNSKLAEMTGASVQPMPVQVQRPGKGEVVRVSPGMYMNDKGHVGPAKTVREALVSNYKSQQKKES